MEDRIAEAGENRDGREAPEGMRDRDEAHCDADRGEAARQDRASAVAIDGETRRGLRQARHAVEQAAEQADLLEAEAHAIANDQQHRDEGELVIVADAVRDADQADDADVVACGFGGDYGHDLPFCAAVYIRSDALRLAELRVGAMQT